jgi:hypothetical protein
LVKNIQVYDIFISSPSDVNEERDVVEEAIDQINQLNGAKDGFRLNPLRWEKDVSSQFGDAPQKIINEQIGDNYDIFLGIICGRFGQATEEYDSGTEEEFFRAFNRLSGSENKIEILFFFKDPRKSLTPIDAEQFLKVSHFKRKISSMGIYEEFDNSDNLKSKVSVALVRAISRLQKKKSSAFEDLENTQTNSSENLPLELVSDFDDDVGIIELTEMMQNAFEALTDSIEVMSVATSKLGERVTSRTKDLARLKSSGSARADQGSAKIIIEKVAAEMERFCDTLDTCIPKAQGDFSDALRYMQHAVIISHQDGLSNQDDLQNLATQLVGLKEIIEEGYKQMETMRDVVARTPRLTSKLNQAKRRSVASLDKLLDFLKFSSDSIHTTFGALKKQ